MDRTELVLLSIGAILTAVVTLSILYPPSMQATITRQLCEDSDGTWNECGSLCTGEPPGTVCPAVCVQLCECSSGFQCPPGYYCSLWSGKGACRPLMNP